jgi:hypothetical protein
MSWRRAVRVAVGNGTEWNAWKEKKVGDWIDLEVFMVFGRYT